MTFTNETVKAICKAHNDRVNTWLKKIFQKHFPRLNGLNTRFCFRIKTFMKRVIVY